MSIIEAPKQEDPMVDSAPPNPVKNNAKRAFIAFTGMMTIGLGLAGWYVGGRISAAAQARPAIVVAKAITPSPAPIVEAQAQATKAPPRTSLIAPKAGEIYLQLAAMGPHATDDYIKVLGEKGIHPEIAPGPADGLFRIVMGPYPDSDARHKQQQELEAAGIESIVRVY